MDSKGFIEGIRKFGTTNEESCLNTLGIALEKINATVILSPGWFPERLFAADTITELVQRSPLFGYQIWNVEQNGFTLTYIRTGFGAPVVMDCLLLLGLSGRCRTVFFVSSVGGLSDKMEIGDIVLPEYSACGDGASRYLEDDFYNDHLGQKQFPNEALFCKVVRATQKVCEEHGVQWHLGKIFCVDTIVGQYPHLNRITCEGYNAVDMESAAAMKAANMLNIPIASILQVSDCAVKENQSLMAKRTETDRKYRRYVANEIIPRILTESMAEML